MNVLLYPNLRRKGDVGLDNSADVESSISCPNSCTHSLDSSSVSMSYNALSHLLCSGLPVHGRGYCFFTYPIYWL